MFTLSEAIAMKANVGTLDRGLRAVFGIVLIAAALFSGAAVFDAGLPKAVALVIGAVMLGTAAFRFCPLYTMLGIKTCRI
jgi:hypothetical protein